MANQFTIDYSFLAEMRSTLNDPLRFFSELVDSNALEYKILSLPLHESGLLDIEFKNEIIKEKAGNKKFLQWFNKCIQTEVQISKRLIDKSIAMPNEYEVTHSKVLQWCNFLNYSIDKVKKPNPKFDGYREVIVASLEDLLDYLKSKHSYYYDKSKSIKEIEKEEDKVSSPAKFVENKQEKVSKIKVSKDSYKCFKWKHDKVKPEDLFEKLKGKYVEDSEEQKKLFCQAFDGKSKSIDLQVKWLKKQGVYVHKLSIVHLIDKLYDEKLIEDIELDSEFVKSLSGIFTCQYNSKLDFSSNISQSKARDRQNQKQNQKQIKSHKYIKEIDTLVMELIKD